MENYVNPGYANPGETISQPSPDAKLAAVNDLSKRALTCGILAQVIPAAVALPVTVAWGIWYVVSLANPGFGSTRELGSTAFIGIILYMVAIALCMIPGIILGRVAWKRANLARLGAIDLGIRTPAKSVVGKVFGIISFFGSIAGVAIALCYAAAFGIGGAFLIRFLH